jgi:hypothetical protein
MDVRAPGRGQVFIMHTGAAAALLADDHAALDTRLGELCAALERADAAHAFELLDLVWARLAVHIRAEHLRLFPALMSACARFDANEHGTPTRAEAQRIIARLRHDHDLFMHELAGAVQTMRELTAAPGIKPAGARQRGVLQTVLALRERLAQHNELEEERVYRWASALLSADEQAQLIVSLRRELENLPPRFKDMER